MIWGYSDDISTIVASTFMKISGLWMAGNRVERLYRCITLIYSVSGLLFVAGVVAIEFYYTMDDLSLLVLLAHRKDFLNLVRYLERKFLHSEYDIYEGMVLDTCKRTCAFFICTFTCSCHGTLISYVLNPIVVNIGKNTSDRVFPLNMRADPLSVTPYFEIVFLLQVLSVYQVGVLYFSFDNYLCIMNLHVAGQFRILQYRLENMKGAIKASKHSGNCKDKYYDAFKTCVQQHQALIAYCDKLEEVFSFYSLGQVFLFSLLICLDGYMVLVVSTYIYVTLDADAHPTRRLIFVFHMFASIAQLFMFTYSCDCIMQDSTNVAMAIYSAPWPRFLMNEDGRTLRRDLKLMMLRSKVPCCLTGYGFFTVSLETYTRVLSTALSYFTLLRGTSTETP
ncbi:odorant receptor 13a-like [Hylaeus anthracinus]|uniref:odorant receptor 13a-like n=1 Tax=Hylaeus anthracinus TaxID=313031 RepID=UPI0023BA08C6|nr:odorant receptor 13a-like [Hylaeus anthracinus]